MPLLFFVKKVKASFTAVGEFIIGLFEKIPKFSFAGSFSGFKGKISGFLHESKQRLLVKIPDKKHRLVLLLGAGSAVLLVFTLVLMLPASKEKQAAGGSIALRGSNPGRMVIPPEDIFLPEEPDFVPGVLTEREQRTSWTSADAAPYWQDPLKYGEENWRERVEAVIDGLFENVP